MTRKILLALIATSLALFVFISPHSAQERQVGTRKPNGERSQDNRQIMDMSSAEKLRRDLITAFSESEALVSYLASYEFLRQNKAMEDYETVLANLAKERGRVQELPAADLLSQAANWPDSESLSRVVELSQQIRNDAKLREAIKQAERYYQAGLRAKDTSSAKAVNSRNVTAAPAYIPPICSYDDPSDYPSGTDLAIPKGIALALHSIASALPDDIGFLFSIPNIIKIVIVIAAGVVDQVANALEAVAADAKYCEGIRLYVEDKLANESGLTAILYTDDFYLTFTVKTVKATLTKATSLGIPTNCAMTRLTEAQAYFNGSDVFTGASGADRVVAFKKLREAFLNIGAPQCVP